MSTFPDGGHQWLLVIGIDDYLHMPKLFNAVKDAKDVRDVLLERYEFDQDRCLSLFDGEATQAGILKAFDKLVTEIKAHDRLLIYFSGHGEFREHIDLGFWIPVDGELDNTGSYISFDFITKYIKAIKSLHTFIIADSCYSGSFFTERNVAKLAGNLERIPSRWLLTAGRNEVVSDGKPGDNSPFADALLWHLKNNKEGLMSVSSVCQKVIAGVNFNANQVPRGEPLHGVGHRGGEYYFRLKGVDIEVPAFEPVPEGREAFVGRNVNRDSTLPPDPQPVAEVVIESIDDLRNTLREYLTEDSFEEVFQLAKKWVSSSAYDQFIMQQGRYNRLVKKQMADTISEDNASRETNKIRQALLYLVNQLEASDMASNAD